MQPHRITAARKHRGFPVSPPVPCLLSRSPFVFSSLSLVGRRGACLEASLVGFSKYHNETGQNPLPSRLQPLATSYPLPVTYFSAFSFCRPRRPTPADNCLPTTFFFYHLLSAICHLHSLPCLFGLRATHKIFVGTNKSRRPSSEPHEPMNSMTNPCLSKICLIVF